jgi:hypothetical protein
MTDDETMSDGAAPPDRLTAPQPKTGPDLSDLVRRPGEQTGAGDRDQAAALGPRIFVEVLRPLGDGQYAGSRKEISLMEWERTRNSGSLVVYAINTALAELGYKP